MSPMNASPDNSPAALPVAPRPPGTLKELALSMLPESGCVTACLFCGACASGCPASDFAGMDPRKLVRMVCLGMDQDLLDTDWVWMCTLCKRCVNVCPMDIDIPGLVYIIRHHQAGNKKPPGILEGCTTALKSDTCSSLGLTAHEWQFIVEDLVDDVRSSQQGFEKLMVPMDKQGAHLFLNQHSGMPLNEPEEMAALWKIMHLAGADWTYGSTGWAAENFGYFLADTQAWKKLVKTQASAVERQGSKVLVNTECGHNFFAFRQGLETFKIPHSFEVKSIIEYYAQWIREGRLKVSSDWNLDLKIKFTVQDPCQLVRKSYGDFIAEELRFVIQEAVGEENFIDMVPNRSNNYCCGGGGGALYTNFTQERMEYGKIKLEQILETEASYCIVTCNNCHSQILDLSRHYQAGFNTVHLWSILCLAMGVLGENERKYFGDDLARVGSPQMPRRPRQGNRS